MSPTAKLMGIAIPVLISTTFCLSVPFIIILADVALLAGAVVAWMADRPIKLTVPNPLFRGIDDADSDVI